MMKRSTLTVMILPTVRKACAFAIPSFLALALSFQAKGQDLYPERSKDVADVIVAPVLEADQFRPWMVTAHYSQLDLILPGKYGIAIARRGSERTAIEFEYTHGSFVPFFIDDIGKFTEDRFSILRRFAQEDGAGFQWFYGAFYHRFQLKIGDALLSRLSGGTYPSADVVSIGGLGAMVGIGYRWIFKDKFVLGLDAVTWSQPFLTTSKDTKFLDVVTNADDRSKVDTAVRVMQYFPRFSVAKVEFGFRF